MIRRVNIVGAPMPRMRCIVNVHKRGGGSAAQSNYYSSVKHNDSDDYKYLLYVYCFQLLSQASKTSH